VEDAIWWESLLVPLPFVVPSCVPAFPIHKKSECDY